MLKRLLCRLRGGHAWRGWITSRFGDYRYCRRCGEYERVEPFAQTICLNCGENIHALILAGADIVHFSLRFCSTVCLEAWLDRVEQAIKDQEAPCPD